jgi:hypothetical protein
MAKKVAKRLCLDTSVQIDRLFERDRRKRELERYMKGAALSTTMLVLRQFKANAIKAAITLYDILAQERTDSGVEAAISCRFSKREMSILLKVWATVKRELGEGPFMSDLALSTLRNYVKGGLLDRFHARIDGIPDTLACAPALEQVEILSTTFALNTSCDRRTAACHLPDLYKRYRTAVLRGCDACRDGRALPKEQDALEPVNAVYPQVNSNGREDWALIRGNLNCHALSDLTILLDSPDYSAVFTTDRGFEYLYKHIAPPKKRRPEVCKYSS